MSFDLQSEKLKEKKRSFPLRYVLKVPLHALSKGAETFPFLCVRLKNGLKEIEVLRERCERTSYTPQLTTAPNLACPQLWRSWSDFLYHDNTWNCKNMRDIQLLLSVNLQYNMLGHLDDGTNELSTKRLMFQVLFFFMISCKNPFNLFSYFFITLQK